MFCQSYQKSKFRLFCANFEVSRSALFPPLNMGLPLCHKVARHMLALKALTNDLRHCVLPSNCSLDAKNRSKRRILHLTENGDFVRKRHFQPDVDAIFAPLAQRARGLWRLLACVCSSRAQNVVQRSGNDELFTHRCILNPFGQTERDLTAGGWT